MGGRSDVHHCHAGVVQTLGLDEGKYYHDMLDLWSDISPPQGHVTLVSLPFLDLGPPYPDRVELRAGAQLRSPLLLEALRSQAPPAAVYRSRALHVHFVSGLYERTNRGFRLLFTYHKVGV